MESRRVAMTPLPRLMCSILWTLLPSFLQLIGDDDKKSLFEFVSTATTLNAVRNTQRYHTKAFACPQSGGSDRATQPVTKKI